MISLSITRTELALGALTVTDTGTSGIVLVTLNEGDIEHDNQYATSRWVDGAQLISSRRDVTSIEATFRAWGTTHATLTQNIDALYNALNQFTYTITATFSGGGTRVYTCMPANYSSQWDPPEFRRFTATVTARIPRQP